MGQHYLEGLLTATFSFGGVSKAKNVGNIHYRHKSITTIKSETVININLKYIISFEIKT